MEERLMEIPERRAAKRLRVSIPVSYEYLGDHRRRGETVTQDVSTSGLRVNMETFFAPAVTFLVKIRFPEAERIVEGMAQVVWSHRLPYSDRYQSGLKFYEISPISRRWIEEYVLIHEAMGE